MRGNALRPSFLLFPHLVNPEQIEFQVALSGEGEEKERCDGDGEKGKRDDVGEKVVVQNRGLVENGAVKDGEEPWQTGEERGDEGEKNEKAARGNKNAVEPLATVQQRGCGARSQRNRSQKRVS